MLKFAVSGIFDAPSIFLFISAFRVLLLPAFITPVTAILNLELLALSYALLNLLLTSLSLNSLKI